MSLIALEKLVDSEVRPKLYEPICLSNLGYSRMYSGFIVPPGAQFDLPCAWEPPVEYGIGGPGEARCVFPGLVQRERIDFSGHNGSPIHNNTDYFSVFEPKKPLMLDDHFKPW